MIRFVAFLLTLGIALIPAGANASMTTRPQFLSSTADNGNERNKSCPRPKVAPPELTPNVRLPWGLNRIKAIPAWKYSTGRGIKVAVIDSGVALHHPALDRNVVGGFNASVPGKSALEERRRHGTWVAGIIAARALKDHMMGVAPDVSIYAIKIEPTEDDGLKEIASYIIRGIDWAIANRIHIINLSLGWESAASRDLPELRDAITRAARAGILVIAAAGNSYCLPNDESTVKLPAAYPEVIAVSATNRTDALAHFSSRGEEIDLAAPGVNIVSTSAWYRLGEAHYMYLKKETYLRGSGTSASAPYVAGVAALVWAAHPEFTAADVRACLEKTADDLGPKGHDQWYGWGVVNAEKAVACEQ